MRDSFARCRLVVLGFVLLGLSSDTVPAFSAEQNAATHPIVLGFERFADKKSAPDTGRLLLGELNCLSCHQATSAVTQRVNTKQAPILDEVGSRVRLEYLRAFLNDPQHIKPGTTMPNLLAAFPEAERQKKVEALVHFLATTGNLSEQPADGRKVGDGERLFHEVGCTACHAPQNEMLIEGNASIALGDLSEKYTVPSLTEFLLDPLKVRPSGRMPAPHLNKNETEELVSYLLKDLVGTVDPEIARLPKIPYRYYEGSWPRLLDFEKLKPRHEDLGPAFHPQLARRNDNFALVFDAWFEAPIAGSYTFEIASDDGSDLWVDGKRIVNNDGLHAVEARRGRVSLEKGPHRVRVRYFQAGGGMELAVKMAGPGLPLETLGPKVARNREELKKKLKEQPPKETDKPRFVIQPELVDQGRVLFAELGCASCHQLKENDKPLQTATATRRLAPPLDRLTGSGGCLAEAAQPNTPFYALSKSQRNVIEQALQELKKPVAEKPGPETLIAETMLTFNCYACHDRHQIGGVPKARNALFRTTQQEMGDEGRIPPSLDGVGAKLTTGWLKKIFAEGAKDRPYMLARMPRFGERNVGHLQKLFESVDTIETIEVPELDLPLRRVKSLGRKMCGDGVFGCIKCHTFKGQRALGIQSIDMAIMARRLKHDWFHRYLVNPAAYRPGTRMPTAWPLGRSTLRDVLDANTELQIEAIWQYLSDGGHARPPEGLNREAIVLTPGKGAVIYRNFISGVGPRAIAVGYPEQVNLAFDAGEMRLALIWQNKFLDASKHWVGRGSGFQEPLGDQVISLWNGPTLARLEKPDADWPTGSAKELGYEFRGYKLTKDNRPTFLYDFGDIRIEDFPTGVATVPRLTLKRTLTFKRNGSKNGGIIFRAAVGKQIEETSAKTYLINEDFQIRIESDAEPILVETPAGRELRVRVRWKEGRAAIVQEITW